eukprot:TRINITY_DN5506_c0_g1_i1.p1 TRINITY_DN5506_c0_g1~~TRINITY_DN5506_c0_g1_i1.p1  ORF type:complete len:335 (-),score=79.31 TRINITY_DN5506_c0_g1_i1:93-968(-)
MLRSLVGSEMCIRDRSYGGKYVPAVADRLMEQAPEIRLSQLLLFSPLTSPHTQLSTGVVEYYQALGLIQPEQWANFSRWQDDLGRQIAGGEHKEANREYKTMSNALAVAAGARFLPVDVSQDVGLFVELVDRLQGYANQPEFQAAVHAVVGSAWRIHDNDGPVADAMATDIMCDLLPLVAKALNRSRELKVGFASGQYDSTLVNARVEQMVCELGGQVAGIGWGNAEREDMLEGGSNYGYLRAAPRLWFGLIKGEGHLLGFRKPEAMRYLVNRLLKTNLENPLDSPLDSRV